MGLMECRACGRIQDLNLRKAFATCAGYSDVMQRLKKKP